MRTNKAWFLSLLLTACAPLPSSYQEAPTTKKSLESTTAESASITAPVTSTAGKKISATTAAQLSSWKISGAIAARNQNKGWSASLDWSQQGLNYYQIRLSGPLGNGTVLINKKAGNVTYQDGQKTASSSNADELLKQQTGIQLPVNNLYYWVRGLAAPGAVAGEKHDENNHLMALRQGGYEIEYSQYTSINAMALPTHIKLQGHGVFIKLVIKHWELA